MKEIISKELLSAILGTELEVTRYELDENEILFYLMPQNGIEFGRTINIYELMAKAKEWAIEHGFSIISGHKPLDSDSSRYSCALGVNDNTRIDMFFHSEIEYSSVFQACKWVYDNKVKG